MKTPGIITRYDDTYLEIIPEYEEYCDMICKKVRNLCVNKGLLHVAYDHVTYLYCDGKMECKFVAHTWDNVDSCEISFKPSTWNKLPKGYHYLVFRERGWNLVFRYKNCADTPMLLEHVPGDWLEKFNKRYEKAMKKKRFHNKPRRNSYEFGTMTIRWIFNTNDDEETY